MTTNAYPSYNEVESSWADIKVTATPTGAPLLEMADIAALTDGVSVEIGERRGASGGRVMARTRGSKTEEASITFYRGGLQKIYRALVPLAPVRGNQRLVGLVHFEVAIQVTPIGSDEIFETIWRGCRLAGRNNNYAEGSDAFQTEVPISVGEIVDIIDGQEVVLI